MKYSYELTSPINDLYFEYTNSKDVGPASSKQVTDLMWEKMRERGYIMNKTGRKLRREAATSEFDLLKWCIEETLRDLPVVLCNEIREYIKPHNGICSFDKNKFTVEIEIDDSKKYYYIDGIEDIIRNGNGRLIRAKLSVATQELLS